jgi:hypothetical protein
MLLEISIESRILAKEAHGSHVTSPSAHLTLNCQAAFKLPVAVVVEEAKG